jgi:hypothetical protein
MIESAGRTIRLGDLAVARVTACFWLENVVLLPDGSLRHLDVFAGLRCTGLTRQGRRCRNELPLDVALGSVQISGVWCEVHELAGWRGDFGRQLCDRHAAMDDVRTACAPEHEPYEVPAADLAAMRDLVELLAR